MSYQYSSTSYSSGGDALGAGDAYGAAGFSIGGAISDASLGGIGTTGGASYSESISIGGGAGSGAIHAIDGGSYNESISISTSGGAAGGAAAAGRTNQIASDLLALGAGAGSASAAGAGSSFTATSYGGGDFNTGGAVIAGAGGASGGSQIYLSEIEQSIIRSNQPIQINESEEITVNGQRGIWANRAEVANWRGVIPINQYVINEDASPEIITKRSNQTLDYVQELAIRYLRPPTPPAPGEIIIQQQVNFYFFLLWSFLWSLFFFLFYKLN